MQCRAVIGYLRVSTLSQAETSEGLEIQRDKILTYCKERKMILQKFYEDRGLSGAVRDRPGLVQLLKECEEGSVSKVIVYKQDRLSRELTISLWLETKFKRHDIEVSSVIDPEYDLDDPLQKAFKRIADVFAELEKDMITTRMKDGRINNAKNGKRGSGPIPMGYIKVNGKLEINPVEAQWVNKIFKMIVKGQTYTQILQYLDKRGITTKRGKKFSIPGLKHILNNNLYHGEMNFGDISSKGIHQTIISKRMFMKVQRALKGDVFV